MLSTTRSWAAMGMRALAARACSDRRNHQHPRSSGPVRPSTPGSVPVNVRNRDLGQGSFDVEAGRFTRLNLSVDEEIVDATGEEDCKASHEEGR